MTALPPEDAATTEAHRWMGEAHEELSVASYLNQDDSLPARAACFHAHLAAEKSLKALLIARGVVLRRLHDLLALRALLPLEDQERFDLADLDALNPWTIEGRYPADIADTASDRITPLLEAATRVVAAAGAAIDNGTE